MWLLVNWFSIQSLPNQSTFYFIFANPLLSIRMMLKFGVASAVCEPRASNGNDVTSGNRLLAEMTSFWNVYHGCEKNTIPLLRRHAEAMQGKSAFICGGLGAATSYISQCQWMGKLRSPDSLSPQNPLCRSLQVCITVNCPEWQLKRLITVI